MYGIETEPNPLSIEETIKPIAHNQLTRMDKAFLSVVVCTTNGPIELTMIRATETPQILPIDADNL